MIDFTIKDFLLYNGPCFNCGKKVSFFIFSNNKTAPNLFERIPADIDSDIITCTINIKYRSSLRVEFNCKTNEYITTNDEEFDKYLQSNYVYMTTKCNSCMSKVVSTYFEFEQSHIKPLRISSEHFKLEDSFAEKIYHIDSHKETNETIVDIVKYKDTEFDHYGLSFPLMLRGRFKNKFFFIKKIRQLMVFL